MAKASIKFPDKIVQKLSKLAGRTDEILEKTLKAGADTVKPVFAANLEGVIGQNTKRESKSTGQLANSLGITPVRATDSGSVDIKVGFNEPRKDGKRNAMIAGILEHGRSDQPPRPFMQQTQSAVKKPAKKAMIDAFNREVDGL